MWLRCPGTIRMLVGRTVGHRSSPVQPVGPDGSRRRWEMVEHQQEALVAVEQCRQELEVEGR